MKMAGTQEEPGHARRNQPQLVEQELRAAGIEHGLEQVDEQIQPDQKIVQEGCAEGRLVVADRYHGESGNLVTWYSGNGKAAEWPVPNGRPAFCKLPTDSTYKFANFPMNGVLVVDKPAGPTSHDVVNRVRR